MDDVVIFVPTHRGELFALPNAVTSAAPANTPPPIYFAALTFDEALAVGEGDRNADAAARTLDARQIVEQEAALAIWNGLYPNGGSDQFLASMLQEEVGEFEIMEVREFIVHLRGEGIQALRFWDMGWANNQDDVEHIAILDLACLR